MHAVFPRDFHEVNLLSDYSRLVKDSTALPREPSKEKVPWEQGRGP